MYFDTSEFENYEDFEEEAREVLLEEGEIYVDGPDATEYGLDLAKKVGFRAAKENIKTNLRNPIKGFLNPDAAKVDATTTETGIKVSYIEDALSRNR
jgi:hypothetical protein